MGSDTKGTLRRSCSDVTVRSVGVTPFLKWAGGKRWLGEGYASLFDVQFTRFIEPFLGSGAIFFKLAPARAVLTDLNPLLILTYRTIRDHWKDVLELLRYHHRNHSKAHYYAVRAQRPRSSVAKAAQFIYLNRTCWNGLYRVNLQGVFNVPIGTKRNVVLPTDDFERVSNLLSCAELDSCDFEQSINRSGNGDLVFVDPPYTVKHNNNGFIKYNEGLFSWDDQVRLRDAVRDAYRRGAKVIVTNAYHDCVKDLYRGLGEHVRLNRASVIGGGAEFRGRFDEMVIKCL
jgi:DNA adenine methylase